MMKNSPRLLVLSCLLAMAGCGGTLRQDMANQPRQNPLSPAEFFPDDRSARPLLDNTVVHGAMAEDGLFIPKDSNAFPVQLDQKLMERGKERYGIFCSPCHGLQGDGFGMVTMRGMKHPPSFHDDRLRASANGYFFDVITNGFGAMQGYSAQVPPRDRWAIVAYVRALQLSRNAHIADLPANLKEKLMSGGSAQ